MARKTKSYLSPANAVRLIEILIAEGKIFAHDVARLLKIDELEKQLNALRAAGEVAVPHLRAKNAPKVKKRAKKAVTAAVVATRRVQGQYIAHLRKFPKAARGKFQKIARAKSREEAIAAMKKALTK